MKALLTLAVTAILAALAYCVYFLSATATTAAMMAAPEGEIEWLRREFDLSDEQLERIGALREAYRPRCARMCEAIAAAESRLHEAIRENRALTGDLEAAVEARAAVEDECRRETLVHVYAVAAEMGDGRAEKYIAMMAPKLLRPKPGYATADQRNPP